MALAPNDRSLLIKALEPYFRNEIPMPTPVGGADMYYGTYDAKVRRAQRGIADIERQYPEFAVASNPKTKGSHRVAETLSAPWAKTEAQRLFYDAYAPEVGQLTSLYHQRTRPRASKVREAIGALAQVNHDATGPKHSISDGMLMNWNYSNRGRSEAELSLDLRFQVADFSAEATQISEASEALSRFARKVDGKSFIRLSPEHTAEFQSLVANVVAAHDNLLPAGFDRQDHERTLKTKVAAADKYENDLQWVGSRPAFEADMVAAAWKSIPAEQLAADPTSGELFQGYGEQGPVLKGAALAAVLKEIEPNLGELREMNRQASRVQSNAQEISGVGSTGIA